jgi:mRNA deadenylase 3'-5' endonuclease subunit Ccr4
MNNITLTKTIELDEDILIEIYECFEELNKPKTPSREVQEITNINIIDTIITRSSEKELLTITDEDLQNILNEVNADLKDVSKLIDIESKLFTQPPIINLIDDIDTPTLLNRKKERDEVIALDKDERFLYASNTYYNSDEKISVMTYNILSQKYIKRRSRNDLSLDNRMNKIVQEIISLDADIVCLQEANLEVFRKYITKIPKYYFKYSGNSDSTFLNIICYKNEKFKCEKFHTYDLNIYSIDGNRGVNYAILEDILKKKKVYVCNIHLPWKPKYEFHRCKILAKVFEDIASLNVPNIILAGDFNSIPESLPIKLIYKRYYEIDEEINRIITSNKTFDVVDLSNENAPTQIDRNVILDSINLNKRSNYTNIIYSKTKTEDFDRFKNDRFMEDHELRDFLKKNSDDFNELIYKKVRDTFGLISSYEDYKNLLSHKKTYLSNNHPDFSINTINYRKYIDYIFYSSKSLELLKIYKLPDKKEIEKEGFFPTANYPSDHLKLYSEYRYK